MAKLTPNELTALKRKRDLLKQNLVRVKKGIDDRSISTGPSELEVRLELAESDIAKLLDAQSEIEENDLEDAERAEVEDICVCTKGLLKKILKYTSHSSTLIEASQIVAPQSRLPKLSLPKFSGKYSEFKNFINMFENLVHKDSSIPDIEKFNHLISCLSGDALGTVKAFQMTAANYSKALESLKKVYDNDCLIFFENVTALFNLSEIKRPSSTELRQLIDNVSAIYGSLLSIGDEKQIVNAFIIHLVMAKVDRATRIKWEEQLDYSKLPLWSECEKALNKRCQHIAAEESSSSRARNSPDRKLHNPQKKPNKSSFTCVQQRSTTKCILCNMNSHHLSECTTFSALPIDKRFQFAKNHNLCINCLNSDHKVSNCKKSKCSVCSKSHNVLLHRYAPLPQSEEQASTSQVFHASSLEQVILATAVVKVKTSSGDFILARAMLDSGSQVNIITEELSQRLKLKKLNGCLSLTGIGKANTIIKSKVEAQVMSRISEYVLNTEFWVMKSISNYQPEQHINTKCWKIPNNIQLADPAFYKPQKIDLLIGAQMFFELLCVGQIKRSPELPVLQKTLFGWVVSGRYSNTDSTKSSGTSLVCEAEDISAIDRTLQKFWSIEEVPKERLSVKFSNEHLQCFKHFDENTIRLASGRFEVKLPFKSSPTQLGHSFEQAKKRFLNLEKRLHRTPDVKEMYNSFMEEYLSLGHMSLTNNQIPNIPHYFIPHQCVLRPSSTTTKLRVVFDASSRSSTQIALNDILMVGPTIQEELFSILLRFRLHQYAVTADITKMYRQVQVSEDDRIYQLVVWRKNPSENLQIFRLNTVTYGTAPAPFLAIRCLNKLSEIYQQSHPIAAEVIRKDFYVDDLLTGADDLETLEIIKSDVEKILSSAGLMLAKWFCNHPSICNIVSEGKLIQSDEGETKTLGITWIPKSDHFEFRFDKSEIEAKATKRNILSISSKLFDPLGLLAPIVIKAKVLLQDLWIEKVDWDESVPLHINSSWERFKENLMQLHKIKIPRYVNTSPSSNIEMHGFSDASIRAYGACIYIRTEVRDKVTVKLLTAKSKVAPLKTKSLPRLELCAAHLLANLYSKIRAMVTLQIAQTVLWTDSEIVLHWVKTHPSTLNTFVANRVADIQELSEDVKWRHVPTKENPADIVSRGCNADEITSTIWFTGPEFLKRHPNEWPVNCHLQLSEEAEALEKKKVQATFVGTAATNSVLDGLNKFSSHPQMVNVLAYMYRFIGRSRKTVTNSNKQLTIEEINFAFSKIVELNQSIEFEEEISNIEKERPLKTHIQKLNPFLQETVWNGNSLKLLRVGGRLLNAEIPFNAKFPMLLSKDSHFLKVYLRHLHLKNLHAGPKLMVSLMREKVWVVNGQEACRKIVRNCIHCFKYKPKLLTQIMGNLPADRLRAVRPFYICGVDFCGPISITQKIRGRPPIKSYICLFVCFATKAIHLELALNLTSECFLLCLQRFMGRRGVPRKIYCDNGTNFVGAAKIIGNTLQAIAEQGVAGNFASNRGCEFVFIPPRAPHFGGLWEAGVKSAKSLLLRTVGDTLLTQEEFNTVLVEVEAVLNSRPLTALSQDPTDGEALTPGHLLIGGPILQAPIVEASERRMSCLERWQLVSSLKQRFWQKWSTDYVRSLQERCKWAKQQPNLLKGQLVVIQEDNLGPQQWMTGRVIATTEGQDGRVRVAEVQTAKGNFVRPIHKLAVLPIH